MEIQATSNPYFVSAKQLDDSEEIIVTMAVDQLWVNPDTNEQDIIAEYIDFHY